MKISSASSFFAAAAALLLALGPRAALSQCRDCSTIQYFKLYTSGTPSRWPVPVLPASGASIDEPGYMRRINQGKCYSSLRTDDFYWNIMMFTDSTYKNIPCCGDTDATPNDYVDLCGRLELYQIVGGVQTPVYKSLTELYWPWFLFGDTQCVPTDYSENSDVFDCNPSVTINNSQNRTGFTPSTKGIKLLPGSYMITGSTYNGCPARPSNQRTLPTGSPLSTLTVNFTIGTASSCVK